MATHELVTTIFLALVAMAALTAAAVPYALTHLEGNVVRFAPLYEKYNGGKAMSSHWMKRRNATIFEPPHKKRRGRVSQNYRDELQRRRAKKARRRANHRE